MRNQYKLVLYNHAFTINIKYFKQLKSNIMTIEKIIKFFQNYYGFGPIDHNNNSMENDNGYVLYIKENELILIDKIKEINIPFDIPDNEEDLYEYIQILEVKSWVELERKIDL